MNNSELSEKEFEIINILADGFRSNQRDLSMHLELSLGTTNLLLRRLVTKGYLRIKQLNRKKVEYLVTPRGIAEKAQKTYHYALKTVESFGLIKEGLNRVLSERLHPGVRRILVVGNGDFADLVELLLANRQPGPDVIKRASVPDQIPPDTLVLSALPEPNGAGADQTPIHLLTALAQHVNFVQTRKFMARDGATGASR